MRDFQVSPAAVSGNGVVLAVREERDGWTVEFMSEPRTSPQPLWFHLECRAPRPGAVRFVWQNADSCLGLGRREDLEHVRPVVRVDGGPWQRVSGQVQPRSTGGHVLSFEAPKPCATLSAAFCFPYSPQDLDETLAALAAIWEQEAIGLTGAGRPLPRLRAPSASGMGVYVMARQHAGETPGSWVLDGMLRAVAEAAPGDPLRQVEWWALPFGDLDGAVEGNYGKDATPWDFNRAWALMPMRPEVLAIQHDMQRFAARCATRLVLDLHAPGGGETAMYQFLPRDERPRENREAALSFTGCLAAEFPDVPVEELARVPRYPSRWTTGDTATTWSWDYLGATLGISLETSYQSLGDGPPLEPADYRAIGAHIAGAAAAWLRSQAGPIAV